MDADGTKNGFDLELIEAVRREVSVPLVASGGAGAVADFAPAVDAGANAVLAASVFHFGHLTIGQVKDACAATACPSADRYQHVIPCTSCLHIVTAVRRHAARFAVVGGTLPRFAVVGGTLPRFAGQMREGFLGAGYVDPGDARRPNEYSSRSPGVPLTTTVPRSGHGCTCRRP
jgi:hypothetical protein